MKLPVQILLLLVFLAPAVGAEPAYVSDQIEVMVRRGQATGFAILDRVRGGEAVEILARENGYAQIRTPRGVEGWVVERYLMDRAPAATRVQQLQEQMEALRAEKQALDEAVKALKSATPVSAEAPPLPDRPVPEAVPEDLASAALRDQLERLEIAVRQTRRSDQPAARGDLMLAGAGILLLGMLLGFVLSRSRRGATVQW